MDALSNLVFLVVTHQLFQVAVFLFAAFYVVIVTIPVVRNLLNYGNLEQNNQVVTWAAIGTMLLVVAFTVVYFTVLNRIA